MLGREAATIGWIRTNSALDSPGSFMIT
jgi:hypothetical protein